MHKFEAIFNDKKITLEVPSLWDAKKKAIVDLKVPRSKEGLLSVYSVESYAAGDFMFN